MSYSALPPYIGGEQLAEWEADRDLEIKQIMELHPEWSDEQVAQWLIGDWDED